MSHLLPIRSQSYLLRLHMAKRAITTSGAFADLVGVSRQTVGAWMRDKPIGTDNLGAVAHVLHLNDTELGELTRAASGGS